MCFLQQLTTFNLPKSPSSPPLSPPVTLLPLPRTRADCSIALALLRGGLAAIYRPSRNLRYAGNIEADRYHTHLEALHSGRKLRPIVTLFLFYLNLKIYIYIYPKRYFLLRFVRNVFVLQVPVLNANGNANLKASIRNTINFTASWEVDKTKFIVKFE